jgi:hypothetical protein
MYIEEHGNLEVIASAYRLSFRTDRPFAILETPSGSKIAELFLFAGVNQDDTTCTGTWTVIKRSEDEIVLENTVFREYSSEQPVAREGYPVALSTGTPDL